MHPRARRRNCAKNLRVRSHSDASSAHPSAREFLLVNRAMSVLGANAMLLSTLVCLQSDRDADEKHVASSHSTSVRFLLTPVPI